MTTPIPGIIKNGNVKPVFDAEKIINLNYIQKILEPDFNEGDIYYEEKDDTIVIGFTESNNKEECHFWFEKHGYGYKPDETKEYSAIVSETHTTVIRSRWVAKCAPSKSSPEKGDLIMPGTTLAFSLPIDALRNYSETKYLIDQMEKFQE